MKGLAAVKGKGEWWLANHEIHSAYGGTHGEMTLDGQRIMMGQGQSWRAPATLATGQQ